MNIQTVRRSWTIISLLNANISRSYKSVTCALEGGCCLSPPHKPLVFRAGREMGRGEKQARGAWGESRRPPRSPYFSFLSDDVIPMTSSVNVGKRKSVEFLEFLVLRCYDYSLN